ncbi:MAG: glycerol-3-phosphate 1-O-acyltransferase PlsY [Burkholderiaceae bacterium]|nr:glycerol-3-phosphate 1-O-acyltransferase PlsY [Burkholderiaceae bacterium]
MQNGYPLVAVVLAYLVGSISFAVLVSRAMGLADPRSYGSRNPGATNVLRTGNKLAAALTLLGDGAKGWAAVAIARLYGPRWGLDESAIALVALAVFVGHLYPVFHRFHGGKGVATAAGVLLALHPLLGVGALTTWLLIAFFFRYSSLAALVAAVFAPLWDLFLFGAGPNALAIGAMSALLVWRHRANLAKLVQGKESRIGKRSSPG